MGPVYKLARVDMNERNKYELLVRVHFTNGQTSSKVESKPFLIQTMKKNVDQESAGTNIYTIQSSTNVGLI